MSCLLGRKIGMTQEFLEEGRLISVSVIQAGPCRVIEKRMKDKHGYDAVVLGYEAVEGARVHKKARLGYYKKLGVGVYRVVREFREGVAEVGTEYKVDQFSRGDRLIIEGVSKGKGWTGVIKKWNFSRGRMSHGGNCKRKMGSAGQNTEPAHVIKGKKMSGRWGCEKITLRSVKVVKVIPEENLLLVRGPLPGGYGSLVSIQKYPDKNKLKVAA